MSKGYFLRSAAAGKENYYVSAAESGKEPAGRWEGKGLAALGLSAGSVVDPDTLRNLFTKRLHPVTGEVLGRTPHQFAKLDEEIAAQVDAAMAEEPEEMQTPERRRELTFMIRANGSGHASRCGTRTGTGRRSDPGNTTCAIHRPALAARAAMCPRAALLRYRSQPAGDEAGHRSAMGAAAEWREHPAQSRPGRAAGQSGHLPCCDETVIKMAPQWPQLIWQVLQQGRAPVLFGQWGVAVAAVQCRVGVDEQDLAENLATWREAGSGAAGGLANVGVPVMVLPLWLA